MLRLVQDLMITQAMFRLKKNGKKLSLGDYQDGLERCNEGAKAAKSISMADPKNILCALEGKRKNKNHVYRINFKERSYK